MIIRKWQNGIQTVKKYEFKKETLTGYPFYFKFEIKQVSFNETLNMHATSNEEKFT